MVETKSILTDIANSFIKIFDVDRFRDIVGHFVKENYDKGAEEVEQQFDFNVDFNAAARDVSMLEQMTFDNIKGMTDDLQNKLRGELQRGMLAGETPKELRTRVADIFKGDNPTRFRYEDRIRTIVRTESKRAQNMARFANVERLGIPVKKWLSVVHDDRTSVICLAEDKKYGSPDKAIPMDKEFTVTVGGKTYTEMFSPFHPNCRTTVIFTQPKEKGD